MGEFERRGPALDEIAPVGSEHFRGKLANAVSAAEPVCDACAQILSIFVDCPSPEHDCTLANDLAADATGEEARNMWDLALALKELRDDLAETQRKISVLEQVGRELMAIVDRCDEPELDPLIRRHLDEIADRMALALDRPASIAWMQE